MVSRGRATRFSQHVVAGTGKATKQSLSNRGEKKSASVSGGNGSCFFRDGGKRLIFTGFRLHSQ